MKKILYKIGASISTLFLFPLGLAGIVKFSAWFMDYSLTVAGYVMNTADWGSDDKAMFSFMSLFITYFFIFFCWAFIGEDEKKSNSNEE